MELILTIIGIYFLTIFVPLVVFNLCVVLPMFLIIRKIIKEIKK